MATSIKRKHSHKRSSSLAQLEEYQSQEDRNTLVSQIGSNETMQLLKACQNNNSFQVIVDSFDQNCEEKGVENQNESMLVIQGKSIMRNGIFNQYFQIEQVKQLKRQDSQRNTLISDQLTLERLQAEPKINGRLRYHRNQKERVFTMSTQKLQFFEQSQMLNLDQICCKMQSVKV